MELKFYICDVCGQIVTKIKDTGNPLICCGEEMKEIVPGSVDAASEKHVPVYNVDNGHVVVDVGSIPHPMEPEHFIEWVVLETSTGAQIKKLKPGDEPKVRFGLCCDNDKVVAAYAYCNIHGLWKG